MWQRIKEWFMRKRRIKLESVELKNLKTYYEKLQQGALFLSFVHEDFKKQKKQMSRSQRRRWELALIQKGQFSEEIVMHYLKHVDKMLHYINQKIQKTSHASK